ncbi:MAG: hypothetical protein IKA00_03955 [Prevotella sp.]|nr:hypothetical protein [Prevotella sp.]
MKKEFYDRLKAVIAECEAHPYKTTMPIDMENGWQGRISKETLEHGPTKTMTNFGITKTRQWTRYVRHPDSTAG